MNGRRIWIGFVAVLIGLLAWDTIAFHLNAFLNHDVAWVLYSTQRLMEGGAFGREVVAVNPPLIWWLSMPVVGLARLTGWALPSVFVWTIALAASVVLIWAYWALRGAEPEVGVATRLVFILALGCVFFFTAYRDFGQREYLALLSCIPYALTVALRLGGQHPGAIRASIIGVVAGIGFSLKPYFLAIPLLVEAFFLIRQRRLVSILRPETIGMAAVIACYMIAIGLFAPLWLTEILPVARETYSAFDRPWDFVLLSIAPYLVGLGLVILASRGLPDSDLVRVLSCVALGFCVSYFVQQKGYTYHAYPIRSLTFVLLALVVGGLIEGHLQGRLKPTAGIWSIILGVALLLLGQNGIDTTNRWRANMRSGGTYTTFTDRLVDLVETHAAGSSFLALSTHPYPGFPTVVYTDAAWVGHSNSRLLLPAVARGRAGRGESQSNRELEQLAWDMLIADLERTPRLLLVDSSRDHHGMDGIDFDLLAFYIENERVRELLAFYDEREPLGRHRVFVRRPDKDDR